MYIGIDIGGTKCAVVKADNSGNIVDKIRFETTNYSETINNIIKSAKKMGNASSIGISCGGPLNSKTGIIMSPPNLPGWDNIKIVKILEDELNIKTYLQNDANACALAEWRFGAGKGCKNMVFLTFGTGMGAGLIINGEIYDGASGNAGEIGHIRMAKNGPVGYGKSGSFEGFCSGNGIKQLGEIKARELFQMGIVPSFCSTYSDLDKINAKDIARHAEKGSQDAIEVYDKCAYYLAHGLAILIDILNPEKIVIGSIYERSAHLLKDKMTTILRQECLQASYNACDIVPAALGDKIGDLAAISVAMQ